MVRSIVANFLFILAVGVISMTSQAGEKAPQKAEEAPVKTTNPRVNLVTNKGAIVIELYPDKAPESVKNFIEYVNSGYYNGTTFHRVIPNFMIQGGGFEPGLKRKETREPIKNEADNGLKNDIGTIAMARTNVPHSATSQFFINTRDNDFLNHTEPSPRGWGYAVFGKVIEGMDTVKAIEQVSTGFSGGHQNVPAEDVIIEKATMLKDGS